jgi:hypothetical protein
MGDLPEIFALPKPMSVFLKKQDRSTRLYFNLVLGRQNFRVDQEHADRDDR